jgi:hypothetical protein
MSSTGTCAEEKTSLSDEILTQSNESIVIWKKRAGEQLPLLVNDHQDAVLSSDSS